MVDLINQVQNMVKFFHNKKATSRLHKAVTLADNNYIILNLRNTQINNEDSFDNTNDKIENLKNEIEGIDPDEYGQIKEVDKNIEPVQTEGKEIGLRRNPPRKTKEKHNIKEPSSYDED